MKKFYLAPLNAYQYISRLLPASCRYYPSCSEYAKWQFELNRADKALAQTTLRILRCNQLFDGGIDYPIIRYKAPRLLCLAKSIKKIKYWFVPKEKGLFYIIKDYGAYPTVH
ncbi:MAG TPA: membrane protein insertion efficiency factor YidD [Sulfurovum sp.]|nr:membrane protein insertion efficiency factor YidD [Sulfurovum sp.]HIM94382.1 membrane protein insertion efficiency factor YidD [Campylobacterales bacterium]